MYIVPASGFEGIDLVFWVTYLFVKISYCLCKKIRRIEYREWPSFISGITHGVHGRGPCTEQ